VCGTKKTWRRSDLGECNNLRASRTRLAGAGSRAKCLRMESILRGSCLCGGVTYRVAEPFRSFILCHCSRCRKDTGSAHTSNLRVGSDQITWTSGQELIVRFDLPSARSFSRAFCLQCGSPLPHLTRSGREVIVPAGSLDAEPSIHPQCHAHWSSRASWTCDGDALPRFDAAPS
jgi:hypothetical protein